MKKVLFLFFMVTACFLTYAQDNKIKLQGYTQLRYTSDFAGKNAIELRRLKFKIASTPSFSQNFFYTVSVETTSKHEGVFSVLDMYAGYRLGSFKVSVGQLLPDFSLERFQSDAKIPTIERALLIDNFLPTANMGARDLGVQLEYDSDKGRLHSSFGIFNGRGYKYWTRNNRDFLLVHKTMSEITPFDNTKILFGYSLAYRRAYDLPMPKILPDTIFFSGRDFRVNIFSRLESKKFSLQGEWTRGWLNAQVAEAYYVLAEATWLQHQFTFSYERFFDLLFETNDYPWFYIGYNYLIDSYYTKIATAFRFQYYGGVLQNPSLVLQYQIFLFK